MDDRNTYFVDFNKYCKKCKYEKTPEAKEPCNECLEVAGRIGTRKPINYKEEER